MLGGGNLETKQEGQTPPCLPFGNPDLSEDLLLAWVGHDAEVVGARDWRNDRDVSLISLRDNHPGPVKRALEEIGKHAEFHDLVEAVYEL